MVNRPILQTITSHHLKGRFSIRTVVSRFGTFALLPIYTWPHSSNWKYQIYFFLKIFKIQIYKIQRTPDLGAPTPDYSASFTLVRGGLWWMRVGFEWVFSYSWTIWKQICKFLLTLASKKWQTNCILITTVVPFDCYLHV